MKAVRVTLYHSTGNVAFDLDVNRIDWFTDHWGKGSTVTLTSTQDPLDVMGYDLSKFMNFVMKPKEKD